jgi:hypothetical protein
MFRLGSARRARLLSWLLLASLMPLLTFMGHWPASIPIPGTDAYLTVPLAGKANQGDHHDHSQHCHGGSASCTDAPAAAGISVALENEPLAVTFAAAVLVVALAAAWRPSFVRTLSPEHRPPRAHGALHGLTAAPAAREAWL